MSRSTKKSYINLIDYKPDVSIGYIYKITDSKGKNYIGSTIDHKKSFGHDIDKENGGGSLKIFKRCRPEG